jgi:integrase
MAPSPYKIDFTKTNLERVKCPENKATIVLTDPRQHGLVLYVGRQRKTWYIAYHFHKKPRREKLGYFPEVSIDEARMRANEIASLVRRGKDPARKHDMTLEQSLEFMIERRMGIGTLSKTTADQYRATLRLYAKDWFKRDIAEITVDEIDQRKHDLAIKEGHKAAANQFVAVMSIIWRMRRLPRLDLERYALEPRESLVEDWAEWYKFVLTQPQVRRNCLLFCAFTGLRSEGARSITWSQIDLEKKTMFFKRVKSKLRDVTVPLNEDAMAILNEQKGLDDKFVFPAARSKSGHIIVIKLKGFKARVHDTRRLFTTCGDQATLSDRTLGKLRTDKVKSTLGHYDEGPATHDHTNRVAERIRETLGIAARE